MTLVRVNQPEAGGYLRTLVGVRFHCRPTVQRLNQASICWAGATLSIASQRSRLAGESASPGKGRGRGVAVCHRHRPTAATLAGRANGELSSSFLPSWACCVFGVLLRLRCLDVRARIPEGPSLGSRTQRYQTLILLMLLLILTLIGNWSRVLGLESRETGRQFPNGY